MLDFFSLNEIRRLKSRVDYAISKEFQGSHELDRAISYALNTGGKRIRPILVLLMGDALGYGLDVMPAALATEFFHTASVIVDDLPCMDDDDERRGKPSLHKEYSERIALLASYGLISEAFGKIEKNGQVMKGVVGPFSSKALEATSIAVECASRCAGVKGATLGQFFDLNRKQAGLDLIEEVIYLKTTTLFIGTFVLGFVFGGGDFAKLSLVEKLAMHFGLAFQIRDDILDVPQDLERLSHANYALTLGIERAHERFLSEIAQVKEVLEELGLFNQNFHYLIQKLSSGLEESPPILAPL